MQTQLLRVPRVAPSILSSDFAHLSDQVADVLDEVDNLLCMTVNPGWGGQEFIDHSIAKLKRLRELLPEGLPLEVDGGIDATTAPRCRSVGATLFVAGSAVFGSPDPGKAY